MVVLDILHDLQHLASWVYSTRHDHITLTALHRWYFWNVSNASLAPRRCAIGCQL
jgi:hypothetical protein